LRDVQFLDDIARGAYRNDRAVPSGNVDRSDGVGVDVGYLVVGWYQVDRIRDVIGSILLNSSS
jgi:hypothetical protein